MAFESYMTFKGTKQGTIKGSSTKGKHTGGVVIQSFSFGVESPFDEHSGLPTGKRTHKPIVIVREVDEASPLLFQALCENESFTTASLNFAKPSSSGKLVLFNTIELTNATISEIGHAQNQGGKRRERIILKYEKLLVNGLSDVVIHSV
jgi:type VI secretion system secreted protein Hcp